MHWILTTGVIVLFAANILAQANEGVAVQNASVMKHASSDSSTDLRGSPLMISGNRVRATGTLRSLVMLAYDVTESQISAGPYPAYARRIYWRLLLSQLAVGFLIQGSVAFIGVPLYMKIVKCSA